MLHTLTESGHMMWTCLCGADLMSHVSHPDVQHPSRDEYEAVIEGIFTDDEGKVWTRYVSRPTGNKIVYSGTIMLPKCDCGKQTFLIVPTSDEHIANAGRTTADGTPTNASIEAIKHTKELARQMAASGKGPTT